MPNTSAATKALRQTKKRTARNQKVKSGVEIALRQARKAIVAKSNEAKELVKQAVTRLDRAAQKGALKPNTASRLKSRLMKLFHSASKK
ncbi:MAG: 30S ribosomal protein S20 [Candidatus Veblenbacteria bacterium]|nr:30S ribosomal protein S20 [Candidatus Veblenbacteria bacterium]